MNDEHHTTPARVRLFGALADHNRMQIVELLADHNELSGSELAEQLNISLSLLCHHSKTLVDAGVVVVTRVGQTKYHSLNRHLLGEVLATLEAEIAPSARALPVPGHDDPAIPPTAPSATDP